jgi:CRP-like cAMP-binding protein/Fe-S-cluster-containing hydrogenase component 2/ferredoxin
MSVTAPDLVKLTIDGRSVEVAPGTTIFEAARRYGITIPVLCHAQHQTPVAVCRVCAVDVKNARVLAAACIRPVENGMEVLTASERVQQVRRTLYEVLLADHPAPCLRQQATGDCELETQAAEAGLRQSRFATRAHVHGIDDSSPIIKVDHAACILCDRCIRACSDVKQNFVIGRAGKGTETRIAFDNDLPMGTSSCVGCGECMVSCPTGALTNKRALDVDLQEGEQISADDLLDLPMFAGASGTFLALNRGSVVRRRFRAGEVICREGEYGSTAFYIVSGRVEVSIASPLAHVKSGRGAGPAKLPRFFQRLSRLVSSDEDPREAGGHRFIPIDASVALERNNPVAQLGRDELFGEMTCLSLYPRSATVRALEDTEVLEMLRNVLYMLQKNRTFKAELERRYRERALATHLRSVPMFTEVSEDFIDHLRDRVTLISFQPGQVIFRENEPADSFYLVRIGFVKVTQSLPGGEIVLKYLARGDYLGEIGLLRGGARTATCTALDHVELVQIRADDFHEMMRRFPAIQARLTEVARARISENQERHERVASMPIGDFLTQGLMEAQNLLLLDLDRCTRCDLCVRACADAHDGVTRLVRDGLRFDKYLVATSCRSCRDPLCMIGCPVGSIRRRDSLEIMIEDWCIGCGLCAQNCPYGNINIHNFTVVVDDETRPGRRKAVVREKATTCDLCHDLKEPSCVYACPHGAAMRVEPLTFFAEKLGLTK